MLSRKIFQLYYNSNNYYMKNKIIVEDEIKFNY